VSAARDIPDQPSKQFNILLLKRPARAICASRPELYEIWSRLLPFMLV